MNVYHSTNHVVGVQSRKGVIEVTRLISAVQMAAAGNLQSVGMSLVSKKAMKEC